MRNTQKRKVKIGKLFCFKKGKYFLGLLIMMLSKVDICMQKEVPQINPTLGVVVVVVFFNSDLAGAFQGRHHLVRELLSR